MKFKKDIFYIAVIALILLLGNIFYASKINNMSERFDQYENTISALNDTIRFQMKDGLANYSKKSPEMNIDEFVNSEAFKTLSMDKQNYYLELSKIRGLIAATDAQMQRQGILLDQINASKNPGAVANDSISFKLGSVLKFAERDTTKKLQWTSAITLDTSIGFAFDYNYNVNIQTQFVRQKDKSIMVTYKIDDPDLKVNSMNNYLIPPEQKATKFGRWFDRNKTSIYASAGGALFIAGGYVGYKLAK